MVAQHQITSQFKPQLRGDDKRSRRENKASRFRSNKNACSLVHSLQVYIQVVACHVHDDVDDVVVGICSSREAGRIGRRLGRTRDGEMRSQLKWMRRE